LRKHPKGRGGGGLWLRFGDNPDWNPGTAVRSGVGRGGGAGGEDGDHLSD